MNINETLLDELWFSAKDSNWKVDLLDKYSCWRDEIEHFLLHEQTFEQRREEAIEIIEKIMTRHGKQELLKYVVELARVEQGIKELEPWVRDHVVHALLGFLLGIFLNEKFFKSEISVGSFQWKLAGLLHDVGYPVQIAKDLLRPFSSKVNEIKQAFDTSRPDIKFLVVPVGLERLARGINSFDLIQECINSWNLDINVRREYRTNMLAGDVCHGMISALAILYVLDIMYSVHNPNREYEDTYSENSNTNWNQAYFENDIIPACSAVFVHNLPARCFTSSRIVRELAPLAFLLRLSDCLQDWERPSKNDTQGYPATLFDISISNGELYLRSNINPERKDKIRDEIYSSLEAPDVHLS